MSIPSRDILLENPVLAPLKSWEDFLTYVKDGVLSLSSESSFAWLETRAFALASNTSGSSPRIGSLKSQRAPIEYFAEEGFCLESLLVTALLALWKPSYEGCLSLAEIAWDWNQGEWRSEIQLSDENIESLHEVFFHELTSHDLWQELSLLGLPHEQLGELEGLAFLLAQYCDSLVMVYQGVDLIAPSLLELEEADRAEYVRELQLALAQGTEEPIAELERFLDRSL